jgi:imidazolonepropionase-like amidohydrolase
MPLRLKLRLRLPDSSHSVVANSPGPRQNPGFAMEKRCFLVGLWVVLVAAAPAQIDVSPQEGLQDNTPRIHALVDARVVTGTGQVLDRATIIVENGLIVALGPAISIPPGARVWRLEGKFVYPGFIDLLSHAGLPESMQPKPWKKDPPEEGKEKKPVDFPPPNGSPAWNPNLTPQLAASQAFKPDGKAMEKSRSLGFTNLLVSPARGIFCGSAALVNTSGKKESVVVPRVAQRVGLPFTGFEDREYPNSLMGQIALIRQTLLDADWYRRATEFWAKNPPLSERPATNDALAALEDVATGKTPLLFQAQDELDLLRALGVAAEFKVPLILEGNGYEYRVVERLKGAQVIVPLNYPEPPEVETPEKALDVPLEDLEHWEMAPGNLARLSAAGVRFTVTAYGLDSPEKTFWPNLRLAVKRGLTADAALKALTMTPARMAGISNRLGSIEPGKMANLVIADGDLFASPEAGVEALWIEGKDYPLAPVRKPVDIRGTWALRWPDGEGELVVEGEKNAPKAKLNGQDVAIEFGDFDQLILVVPAKAIGGGEGSARLNTTPENNEWLGAAMRPDGSAFAWTARRTKPYQAKSGEGTPDTRETALAFESRYPAGGFGRPGLPEQPAVLLIRGATLWTSGPEGNLAKADLLVRQGKISQIASRLDVPPDAVVVEAEGKHVTPGLIDCHSHSAISRGVNEATSAVTCEVRIGDVLDPTDIALYRELAGGVTASNLLHGSANPIGGQNQVIKLRWGGTAEDLKFESAPDGVKFALGENVKQSNWGDRFNTRYPQTRMGVEQMFRDTFNAARDYEREIGRKGGMIPRRDLRLEAALEILRGQRLVHIHSYRQDELLMFVRLTQEFSLPLATFQHVLEGYKVADEIAKVNAGASAFSDWWGYKFEVYDAIPWNGTMMERRGVVTSFNSDSNELARRLNIEAAKAVKYGGMSEEEALRFVTLNPAKQLRIDQHVGSLEPGKDADFVIWTHSPLSTFSRVEQTWIDGRKYFDAVEDAELQRVAGALREQLVQRALPERQKAMTNGTKPKTASSARLSALHRRLYHNGQDVCNCSTAEIK